LPEVLQRLAQGRTFEFDLERAAFALARQHFYRTTALLAQVRQDLERTLFLRDRNLSKQTLDLVFIDTTSLYYYRDEETELRRRGYSRDRRPARPGWRSSRPPWPGKGKRASWATGIRPLPEDGQRRPQPG
jgi:hypothetical protein